MSGFTFNRGSSNNNQQSQQGDDSWKAQGFLNIYLPNKGGDPRKLGVIKLYDSKPAEKALIAWLKDDADGAKLKHLVNNLQVNFNTAEVSEASMFDLSLPAKTGTNG